MEINALYNNNNNHHMDIDQCSLLNSSLQQFLALSHSLTRPYQPTTDQHHPHKQSRLQRVLLLIHHQLLLPGLLPSVLLLQHPPGPQLQLNRWKLQPLNHCKVSVSNPYLIISLSSIYQNFVERTQKIIIFIQKYTKIWYSKANSTYLNNQLLLQRKVVFPTTFKKKY